MLVSPEFRKRVEGYGLTTAEILYYRPDAPSLLQTYIWQDLDIFPDFPTLRRFLDFWTRKLDGPLHSVQVAHNRLVKPTEFVMCDGMYTLN